ncbi:2Fe-2S iron-sulfur cluster-binding protein [Pseudohaliea rubra]|uniref:Ferredoxin, 2Fe-2S n=1 Tax=Pseudohaliea rubra DSM 19751 TaxID=1265313 RepID=A0A095VS50_9GAMM|nr:2Fe-2S iron-sulfur cluster-binding protein [Pseudohaliea rubra]KGE03923.1 Ferredoxin, 2Fe-2S [Pseudohaliea rubra DSM 19751]
MAATDTMTVQVVTREGQQLRVPLEEGHATLMHALYDADIGVEASCGGCAACATCHVLIDEAWVDRLPPRRPEEDTLLRFQAHFDPRRSRLSCQLDVEPALDGLVCAIAPEE